MGIMNQTFLGLAVVFLLGLAACEPSTGGNQTAVEAISAELTQSPTHTAIPTPTATLRPPTSTTTFTPIPPTATNTQVPTATPTSAPLTIANAPDLETLAHIVGRERAAAHWADWGDSVRPALQTAGWLADTDLHERTRYPAFMTAHLNPENSPSTVEWIVQVVSPATQPVSTPRGWRQQGNLWIFGRNKLDFHFHPNETSAEHLLLPNVLSVADFTDDPRDDILLEYEQCSATACAVTYWLITHVDGAFRNIAADTLTTRTYVDPTAHILHDTESYERSLLITSQQNGETMVEQWSFTNGTAQLQATFPITVTVPDTLSELENWLMQNYHTVDPAQLRAALLDFGWQLPDDELIWHDLDSDGADELLITLREPARDRFASRDGGLFCLLDDDGVQLQRALAPFGHLNLFYEHDLTGDQQAELIFEEAIVSGSGYFWTETQIYGFVATNWQPLVLFERGYETFDDYIYMSGSTESAVIDSDGDELFEYTIHGGATKQSQGVLRTFTEVWGFDAASGRIVLEASIPDPLEWQHHAIYDANTLSAAGEIAGARELYRRAIEDDTLRLSGFWEPLDERDAANRYAAFRLMVLAALSADSPSVEQWATWLSTTHPEHPLTTAAQAFQTDWQANQTVQSACETAIAIVAESQSALFAISWLGDANPILDAPTLCLETVPQTERDW